MTTLPAWPDYAIEPFPLNDPLEQTPPNAWLRSDFEQGLARQRNVFRNNVTGTSYQIPMTCDEYEIFQGFLREIGGGLFTMPVFANNRYMTATVQFVKDTVKAARSGGDWLVSFQLETLTQLAPGPIDYAVLLLTHGYDGTLDDLVAQFHEAVQAGLYEALS